MATTTYMTKVDVQEVHIMEETIRGTFEAPAAATNTTFVAQSGGLFISYNAGDVPVDVTGSEDATAILPTLKEVSAVLTYQPVSTEGTEFLKRGMNAIGGSPNPKTTFSVCFKTIFNATTYYYKLKHCLVGAPGGGRVSLGFVEQGPWIATAPIYGKLQAWDASAPTNWTFDPIPSADPLMSADAGATMLTITNVDASTNVTPVVRGASVEVIRNLTVIGGGGSNFWTDIYPAGRRSIARYLIPVNDTTLVTLYNQMHNQKNTTSVLTVKSATTTATLTGGKLVSDTINFQPADQVDEALIHVAETFALA